MLHALQSLIAWTPLGLPAFLFYITLVVFVHEMGHFLVARWFGAKVDAFSIGFGPEIVGFNDKRGTRWKISWLPIGGYVQFAGDANAASAPDRDVKGLSAEERAGMMQFKPLHQRALVAAAGPFANFILAVIIFTGVFMLSGNITVQPLVGFVAKNSPAAEAGIKPGDLVTRIDSTPITDFQQLPQIIQLSGGETLTFQLQRGGHPLTLTVKPRMMDGRDPLGNKSRQAMIGVGPSPKAQVTHQGYGPVSAFVAAVNQTGKVIRFTLIGVGKLITGHASLDQLRGPVGIASAAKQVAEMGLLQYLFMVAVLSVSIGLANLFPVPLLDGGHLLYYGCEAVLGRPLGERAQDMGFRLGLVLVLGLMLVATWNDVVRLNFSETSGAYAPPGRIGRNRNADSAP